MSDASLINNRYRIIKHIGQGGMADVYLAIDTILNREVAIKILRGDLSNDPRALLRFQREANACTSLSHPNIIDIYDVGDDRGHHYIVMEYVKGITLKELIAKRGGMWKEEAVSIMKQLISAVQEAHERNIIHRDIKPQNVLVKDDGTVKLGDFGIALAQDALQLTQTDSVMGSVHYLAPELSKGQQATAQSDIYALGIVFYELVTGDVPFKADQPVQVALKHLREPMPSCKSVNPDLPQSIDNIITRATAKDAFLRYRTAGGLLSDVSTCLRADRENEKPTIIYGEVKEEKVETPKVKKTKKKKKKKKSKVKEPVLLGFFLIVLVLLGVFFGLKIAGVFEPEVVTTIVPNLIGVNVTEAKQLCADNALQLDTSNITYTMTDNVEKGLIIDVIPAVNEEVEKDSKVTVVVSSGIGEYIGDYVGMNIMEAQEDLKQYTHINLEVVEEESDAPAGSVIRQELLTPGSQFNPSVNTDMRLVYAKYATLVIPEEIIGATIEDATRYLEERGLTVMVSSIDTSSYTEEELASLVTGVVMRVTPEIGETYTQTSDSFIVLYYY